MILKFLFYWMKLCSSESNRFSGDFNGMEVNPSITGKNKKNSRLQ